ncbi:MAG: hypothetical protein CO027_01790, partial [Candidatus Komeilibacteria bacterium CG_4_9_14_0_2_um_filter_36_13]
MENHKNISQNIAQHLEKAQNILIVSHRKPDGDTLGSNFAFLEFLLSKNKKVISFCLDILPSHLQFLPHSHLLTNDQSVFGQKYDTVVTIDCGNLDYAGIDHLLPQINNNFILINIDHHASNPHYGHINLVLERASSTAEIIYRLFQDWQIPLTPTLATNLTCGLVTDTDCFKNPATNYRCVAAASQLIGQGADWLRLHS